MCNRRPHPHRRSRPPSCHLSAEREVEVSMATAWWQHSHLSAENIVTVLANDVQIFLWKKRVSCPWKMPLLRIRSVKKADRQLCNKFQMVRENPLPCRENPLPHSSQPYRPLLMNHLTKAVRKTWPAPHPFIKPILRHALRKVGWFKLFYKNLHVYNE